MKTITKSFYHFTPLLWRGRERFFYIILFLSLPTLCSAQKIYFTDSTNFWEIKETYVFASSLPEYFYYDFWYGADTTIGSTVYKKMLCSDSSRGYVREDTAAGIVFYYNSGTAMEDTLYNYNFNSDDTIDYQVGSYNIIDGRDPYFDSALINGVSYKRFDYGCTNCNSYAFYRGYTTIEGIGCLSGPLFPTSLGACMDGVAYISFDLLCFSQNNIAPSFSIHPIIDCSGTGWVTNSSTCGPTGINSLLFTGNKLQVYPNPVKEQLTVETNFVNSIKEQIRIIDISGRAVYNSYINKSKTELDMSSFAEGIYFVEIIYSDAQGASMYKTVRKIVKQ